METSRAKRDVPPGERRRLGARAAPPPRPGPVTQGFHLPGRLVQRGSALEGQGPGSGGSPGARAAAAEPRAAGRARSLGPGTPGAHRGPLGGARLAQQVPGPPDPARPRLEPAPPSRPPAGLTRRGGSRPAAPTGAGQRPGTVPSPARSDELRPPPAVPGRRASPAASAALTSPARGAPSAAAAAGARPVPAAPAAAQPAPPAPGSASRARPLGAGASGQARTEKEGRR